MLLLPLVTPRLYAGDSLVSFLTKSPTKILDGDILIVSSKAVATCEEAAVPLASLSIRQEAAEWSEKCGRSPAFCEAVLQELSRLNGRILHACPGALLTEVKPAGLNHGSILIANAGLDESNVSSGYAIGWPHDPVTSIESLRSDIQNMLGISVGIILSDSCVHPRREGVTAFALTFCSIDPIRSDIGMPDIYGEPLHITKEAIADQLATAGNFLMGNAAQHIPACIVRNHGLDLIKSKGWVPCIEHHLDLFHTVL